MSEQPRVGDLARITYTAHVHELAEHESFVKWVKQGDVVFPVPADAMVEVLEPADDPSRHLVGTVMRGTEGTSRDNVVVRVERGEGAEYHWLSVTSGMWYAHDDLIGFEVIGYVPGTPAAEAQTPLKEWEFDEPKPGPRPSQAARSREPRVFQSDGPEPPADVTCLRWLDARPSKRWPYLARTGKGGWVWCAHPDDLIGYGGSAWATAVRSSPGQYEEVVLS